MKRKVADAVSKTTPASGNRQPQTSCDSCRRKKLKCDRGAPCHNCATRGLSCSSQSDRPSVHHEQSSVNPSPTPIISDSVLERLLRLETAVFGRTSQPARRVDANATPAETETGSTPVEDERREAAKQLDLGFTRSGRQVQTPRLWDKHSSYWGQHRLEILPIVQTVSAPDAPSVSPAQLAFLMTKDEALALLQDFVDNPVHLLPVIHQPTVHSAINQLYDGLANEDPPPDHLAQAALILSIAATSAFFSQTSIVGVPVTPEKAASVSASWLGAALDLTDVCQREGSASLEHVQARVILSHHLYNVEGCSSRFRFMYSSCVALGRDLGLHLVDSPQHARKDSEVTKEIKRRLWWYITSTDWLLGFMGGPLEGTYSVNPRHMNVRPVRNISDVDLETHDACFSRPSEVPTEVSFLIQRVRLSEVCRQALDARPAGAPEEDVVDCLQVLALNHAFDKALAELPPFFQPKAPMPIGAPSCLELQRDTILLAVHSRWARINRPFVLKDDPNGTQRLLQENCLRSARMTVSIATDMLATGGVSREASAALSAPARRMTTTIGHLFGACAVLALNAAKSKGAVAEDADLKKACEVLAMVGEESPVAASLVQTLTSFLRRHGIPGPDFQSASYDVGGGEVEMAPTGDVAPSLDHLWDEFIDSAPDAGSWDELFAGLDVCFGPT